MQHRRPSYRDEVGDRQPQTMRYLARCALCGGWGDRRRMLPVPEGLAHGSCVEETQEAPAHDHA